MFLPRPLPRACTLIFWTNFFSVTTLLIKCGDASSRPHRLDERNLQSDCQSRPSNTTTFVNLSHSGIKTLACLPTWVQTVDLSFNDLQSIHAFPATELSNLNFLNMSFNAIRTTHDLFLPSSLLELDLSHNGLLAFDAEWRDAFPTLTHLSLRSNNLTHVTLTATSFPPSLSYLDLTDNPHLHLALSTDVATRFRQPTFTLRLPTLSATWAGCTGSDMLGSTSVCVLGLHSTRDDNGNSSLPSATGDSTPSYVATIAACLVFFALAIVVTRSTMCRAFDDLPLQEYPEAVSPT
ncbi:Aste57867_19771 [Aphanomyces stellatus]|uniref:Aste57867_19771 protein n=1 Tax=Aphanomyces stellatus TaxID=120398 RepID=A0A485LDH1_9STRA|nr:hypothetical protein As57867_019706 [Aphanomyces stellatus]VFT96469.1 Aste57867_19771 [Aphanomyces stellatus]